MTRLSQHAKASVDDLAYFGGAAEFAHPLHVGAPNIGDPARFIARIEDLFDRRWLTNDGPFVTELERRIAAAEGVRHCVATCNGTAALSILIRALGLTGEVILPSFTFVATAHALLDNGVRPVFCDIDPRTHHLDPDRVEQLISPRTSAILGVHLWGRPCDVDSLSTIAARHGLHLLFDAAHAFGTTHAGHSIGSYGDGSVFSFHATKLVNCFEGGAIVTDDAGVAERAVLIRNFGFLDYDTVVAFGMNGKMSEASAAMGLTSLEAMEQFREVNRRNHAIYELALAGISGISLLPHDENNSPTYHYVVLEVDATKSGIERDDILDLLWAENALVRRYFYPGCHRMEPYASTYEIQRLPTTEAVSSRVLVLPTGTATSAEQVTRLAGLIAFIVENAAAYRSLADSKGSRMRRG